MVSYNRYTKKNSVSLYILKVRTEVRSVNGIFRFLLPLVNDLNFIKDVIRESF